MERPKKIKNKGVNLLRLRSFLPGTNFKVIYANKKLAALFAILLALTGCSSSQVTEQRNIILDDAKILVAHTDLLKAYREYNNQLLEDYLVDLRVITTRSVEDINKKRGQQKALFRTTDQA